MNNPVLLLVLDATAAYFLEVFVRSVVWAGWK
jgi:hypothetical protein